MKCDSIESACDMVEVYEHSLHRDTPFYFIQTRSTSDTRRAAASLSVYIPLGGYRGPTDRDGKVSGGVLFRGTTQGELVGPYVSQFLVLPILSNSIEFDQKYREELDVTSTADRSNFECMQMGHTKDPPNTSGRALYIYNGRMLGSMVHNDSLYGAYYNCCNLMLQRKFRLDNEGTGPYSSWTDQGAPDVLSSIGDIALCALRAAWYFKFNINLKIRPEVLAFRIDQILSESDTYSTTGQIIRRDILHAAATLSEVARRNDNSSYLLKLMYPEGAPCHIQVSRQDTQLQPVHA